MDLICKYCGKELKAYGPGVTANGSKNCNNSPTGTHIALANPPHCVYCGGETKSTSGKLTVGGGYNCNSSPTGNHSLDE